MKIPTQDPLRIARMARAAGATLAGVVSVDRLRAAGALPLRWPPTRQIPVRSVLVMALAHPATAPELDWWGGPGGTEGNRVLIRIVQALGQRLAREMGIQCRDVPYGLERGGVRLKDAAVLAGLGVIGKNNLLITPSHGPRIRLRAMAMDCSLPPQEVRARGGGAADHAPPCPGSTTGSELARGGELAPESPCAGCAAPCQSACPQGAFPSGIYDRARCKLQMTWDEAHPAPLSQPDSTGHAGPRIAYCRACELACPMGRGASTALLVHHE